MAAAAAAPRPPGLLSSSRSSQPTAPMTAQAAKSSQPGQRPQPAPHREPQPPAAPTHRSMPQPASRPPPSRRSPHALRGRYLSGLPASVSPPLPPPPPRPACPPRCLTEKHGNATAPLPDGTAEPPPPPLPFPLGEGSLSLCPGRRLTGRRRLCRSPGGGRWRGRGEGAAPRRRTGCRRAPRPGRWHLRTYRYNGHVFFGWRPSGSVPGGGGEGCKGGEGEASET